MHCIASISALMCRYAPGGTKFALKSKLAWVVRELPLAVWKSVWTVESRFHVSWLCKEAACLSEATALQQTRTALSFPCMSRSTDSGDVELHCTNSAHLAESVPKRQSVEHTPSPTRRCDRCTGRYGLLERPATSYELLLQWHSSRIIWQSPVINTGMCMDGLSGT